MSSAKTTDQVIGARIGEHRKRLGFSLGELSMASGVSRSDFERIESGEKRPEPDQLCRIAENLATTVATLMSPES